jgi:hypothetical protein
MIPSSSQNTAEDFEKPLTPLREAIENEDIKLVLAALKKDGIGEGDDLLEAMNDAVELCVNGEPEILKALVGAGAGTPYTDRFIESCIKCGADETVRILLDAGISTKARSGAMVAASEWMRDREFRNVSADEHAAIVRMLLEAETAEEARDRALVRAAAFGDTWMVWMLLSSVVSPQAVKDAIVQAKKYEETATLAVLKSWGKGAVAEPPVLRPAVFDVYFAANEKAHKALLDAVVPAYAASIEKRPNAEKMIAQARKTGKQLASSVMLDVQETDKKAIRDIAVAWGALGGGSDTVLIVARSVWEMDRGVEVRSAIARGEW